MCDCCCDCCCDCHETRWEESEWAWWSGIFPTRSTAMMTRLSNILISHYAVTVREQLSAPLLLAERGFLYGEYPDAPPG